jgi:superfamily II DNA/RNA helicase
MNTQSFADLGASSAVVEALEVRGFHEPFPVQRMVVPDVLAGRDVLVKSPTGSGKTLAFGVPIVDRIEATDPRPTALVVVPTRELAAQIVEEVRPIAHARALSVAAVYGGAGIEKQSKAARRAHLLVATPGRLEDLIDRGAVSLDRVRILVLDEADRMLDMGFRPAVDRIVRQLPRKRQTLFFSATLDGPVLKVADSYTHDARRHEQASTRERRADVSHRFLHISRDHKLDALVAELHSDAGSSLVFVRTKRGADRLVKRLRNRGVESVAMHGDRSQSQRERALARFASGEVATLVATDVAARGLDIDDIAHVINFDPPADGEDYVHRVGRTGRAGRTGRGTTFVTPEDSSSVRTIAHGLRLHQEFGEQRGGHRNGDGGHRTGEGSPRTGGGGSRRRRRGGRARAGR